MCSFCLGVTLSITYIHTICTLVFHTGHLMCRVSHRVSYILSYIYTHSRSVHVFPYAFILGAPAWLLPWCSRWDHLCRDLNEVALPCIIRLGREGKCAHLRKQLSHFGGVDWETFVEPYANLPLRQFISWRCNDRVMVDCGNWTYDQLLEAFKDTLVSPHGGVRETSMDVNYALSMNMYHRGDIVEAMLALFSVARGDVITGVQSHCAKGYTKSIYTNSVYTRSI